MDANPEYREIMELANMLAGAGIPFDLVRLYDGWRLRYYSIDAEMCSVIEHQYSYGGRSDMLEIRGLLTPEERKTDSVVGFMTAQEVFARISKHWRMVDNEQKNIAKMP